MWFDGRGVVGSRKEVVLWHRPQSPVAGCRRSSAAGGLESPAAGLGLGGIPWKFPVSWQLAQAGAGTPGGVEIGRGAGRGKGEVLGGGGSIKKKKKENNK